MSTALNEVVFIVSSVALSYAFLRCLRDWVKHNIKEFRWWLCFFILRGLLSDCNPTNEKKLRD